MFLGAFVFQLGVFDMEIRAFVLVIRSISFIIRSVGQLGAFQYTLKISYFIVVYIIVDSTVSSRGRGGTMTSI